MVNITLNLCVMLATWHCLEYSNVYPLLPCHFISVYADFISCYIPL